MILKRYGTSMRSVEINFESKAMTEVGFRQNRQTEIPFEEFESGWEKLEEHSFAPTAEGSVQDHTEQAMLDELETELRDLLAELGDDEALAVENDQNRDWPKTRNDTKNVIVEGENKLYFYARIEPALRVGRYRKR